jgi:hypothetical protein
MASIIGKPCQGGGRGFESRRPLQVRAGFDPHQHRSEGSVLLAVDQQLGCTTLARRAARAPDEPSVLRAILPGSDSLEDHFEGAFTGRVVTRDQLAVNEVPEDRREVARAFKHHEINVIAR